MIFDRYLIQSILIGSAIALMTLLGLDLFLELIDELSHLGSDHNSLGDLLLYLLLGIPRRLYTVLPTVLLIGTLIGLGELAVTSELIAMRSLGISLGRIVMIAMMVGWSMSLFVIVLNEWIMPDAERWAQQQKRDAQGKGLIAKGEGLWARSDQEIIHIEEVDAEANLLGITLYHLAKDQKIESITVAQKASYQEDHWVLSEIQQTLFENEHVQIKNVPSLRWESLLSPNFLQNLVVKPNNLSLKGLRIYLNYLKGNHLNSVNYEVAYYRRIFSPLSSMVMILLAVPLIIGPLRGINLGVRILTGALLGIVFHVGNQVTTNLGQVMGITPWVSAISLSVLFLLAGGYGWYRTS